MQKKLLLHITHDLQIGGLQQVVVTLCKYTDRKQFDIAVLCLRERGVFAKELEEIGVPVHLLPQKEQGTDYFAFRKVAKFLRTEQVDIIHTHNTQPFIDGVIGALLSRRIQTIIHTDHARSFPDKKRYMFAEWLLSHFVTRIVGVSEHTSQNLVTYEKISPDKIMTIYNGIDPEPYSVVVDRQKYLHELGLPVDGPIIGLGVRLAQQKGITYLLQAMPALLSAFPNLSLIIAGEGELEADLKKEAESLNISKHVFFLGPRLDMPILLKTLDVYVLPSLWEGLPMVLLEAMAAGCPIVATNVGGNAIAVKNGINGTLVTSRDPGALAQAIIAMLHNDRQREEFARNGFELFQGKFSAEIMAQRYQKLYLSNAGA